MNPQNTNNIPQGQSTPGAYGSNAQARAMMANRPAAQPLQLNTPPTQTFTTPQNQLPPQPTTFPPQASPNTIPAQAPITPNPAMQPGFQTAPTSAPMTAPIARPQPYPQPSAPASMTPPVTVEPPKVVEDPISTQATLMFSELRDSLVIMKDGSFRAVVACQSINFDLMSETEREGVEYSYQNFLNSLNFSVQILVRSQKVDIGPYIERLTSLRRNNDNMLLGVLMDDYINFIDILAQEANIMDKSFFVVIPYYGSADLERAVEQTKNLFRAFGKTKTPTVTRINRDVYNKAIDELNNRVESVISGLFQIGIQSVRLNTKELSELFYNFNNPDTAVREPLVDFTKLATTYVRGGVKEQ